MNKINMLEYDDYKSMKIDLARKKILSKVLELANTIINEKKIDLSKYDNNNECEKIYNIFYYKINLCSDIKYLVKNLGIDYDNNLLTNYDVEIWIKNYNDLVDEFKNYLLVKEEINKKGFNSIYCEIKDNIKKLMLEMLDYKNKDYVSTQKLGDLINKVDQYYQYYHYTIYLLKQSLSGYANGENIDDDSKVLNNVEIIMNVRTYYYYLKDSYKLHAFEYRDYELEEGQTFSDLYIKYLNRNYDLYRDMLDFLHVKYDNNKPPIFIIDEVKKYYPFYIDYIDDKNKPYYDPYASLLTRMDKYYELMSNNYKVDYINEINRYQKFVRNNKHLTKIDISEKLNMTVEEIDKIVEMMNEKVLVEENIKEKVITDDIIKLLKENMMFFNERDQELLDYRFGIFSNLKHTKEETSKKFNISVTRVSQIEAKAIRKVQKNRNNIEY